MRINEIIFTTIKQKGLKQRDLANFLNINESLVTTWKTRKTNPPAEYLLQICEFIGITICDLFEVENESEIERLYKMCTPKEKATIDSILNEYKEQEQQSSTSMIG